METETTKGKRMKLGEFDMGENDRLRGLLDAERVRVGELEWRLNAEAASNKVETERLTGLLKDFTGINKRLNERIIDLEKEIVQQ